MKLHTLPLLLALSTAPLVAQDFTGQILCSDQLTRDVLIMKTDADWSQPDSVLWRWNPAEDKTITADNQKRFVNPSDAKVVANGTQILTVASGGAVTLVDIATRTCVFDVYPCGNPHSADLLPDGSIVTVSSGGNKIMLFTRKPGERAVIATLTREYPDAHGAVWDPVHALVWIIGKDELTAFRYNFNREAPELLPVQAWKLTPSPFHGHDLVFNAKTGKLMMTGMKVLETDTNIIRFNTIFDNSTIKSISAHPETGAIIAQIPKEKWWSDTITELKGDRTWTKPGARFYKARWFVK